MNKYLIVLFACLQVFYIIKAQDTVHICDPFPAPPTTAPILPEIPDIFTTRMEVNIDGKTSSDILISFDYKRRKAAMSVISANLETKLVFDYPTNEIHVIEMYANYTQGPLQPGDPNRFGSSRLCKTLPLDKTDYLNYYFGYNFVNATYMIPNEPLEILHLNFPQTYSGQMDIRGIPCNCYLSCVYRPETKQNYTLEFCFSTFNYSLPNINAQFVRIPVRAEFKGVKQLDNGDYVNFTETNNFYDFRPNFVKEEFFQTPQDLVCIDRKMTQKPPKPKAHFRYSLEENANGFTTYLKDLIYDSERELVSFELRPKVKEEQTLFVTDPLRVIHDYNIGVSFTFNKNLKTCSIRAISDASFDEDFDYTASLFNASNSFVIKLKSAESLLSLDSDYVFTGSRTINSIPADTYVSNRYKIAGTPLTIEYAFTSNGYGFQTSSGVTVNVPLIIIQRAPEKEFYSYGTYYNFDQGEIPSELFDVSSCFPKDDRIEIRFKFPYTGIISADDLTKDEEFIRFEITSLLIGALRESWTRFASTKVSVSQDGFLYVRSAILPSPPSLEFFTLVPDKWLITASLDVKYGVETVSTCASFCLSNIQCLSFDYSPTTKTCFLNPKHGSEAGLRPSNGYLHYSRNTLTGFNSRPSFVLWNTLVNLTKSSLITLSVQAQSNNNQQVRLTASDIEQLADSDNRFGATSALKKYNLKQPNQKFSTIKKEYLLSQNIDGCAHACSDELRFECLSFDFCYISGDCRLNDQYLGDEAGQFIESNECDVYEKDPLYHYNELPGKATVNKEDKSVQVNSPSDCATKCDAETDIHCRSFNFCPESNTCYLSVNHLLDGTQINTADLICTHYSRNYLSDFTFTSIANISLVGDLIYENSNPEACSALCVVADGFSCKSFNFCPSTKKCLLYEDKTGNTRLSAEQDMCSNYIREYFYVTSEKVNVIKSDSSEIVLIILSITFSVFGVVVGLVSAYVFIKKRKL